MKKIILFMTVIAYALSVSAQDSLHIKTKEQRESKLISTIDNIAFTRVKIAQSTTVDTGIVINGVRWATCNVASPGTFTTNFYDAGNFYQWNSKVGWPSSGSIGTITASDGSTTWNSSWTGGYISPSSSDTWTSTNDPSPVGWRVPTYAEIETLLDATKVTSMWTTQNGVSGEKFMDITTGNFIFLPASGCRTNSGGTCDGAGLGGSYWSSATNDTGGVYGLLFYSSNATWSNYSLAIGVTVRPVAK